MSRPIVVLAALIAFAAPALAQTGGTTRSPRTIIIEEEPQAIQKPLPPDPQQIPPPPPAGSVPDALAGRVPYHGNYCGRANRGGEPIDVLDAACKAHDDCYDQVGDSSCTCDRAIEREALALADDPTQSPELRRRAASIAAAFQVATCRR